MKTLQKVLEENSVEMKKLAQHIKAQESQLMQVLDSGIMLTTGEYQLQRRLDILNDIVGLKKKLSDAKDGHHVTATKMKILQEDVAFSQKHTSKLVG